MQRIFTKLTVFTEMSLIRFLCFSKRQGNYFVSRKAFHQQTQRFLSESSSSSSSLPAEALSSLNGIPTNFLKNGSVFIHRHGRKATQSGSRNCSEWILEFDTKEPKWDDALMGWSASTDSLQALKLSFNSMQEAIEYAKSNGWKYKVDETQPKESELIPKSYASNFSYKPPQESFE